MSVVVFSKAAGNVVAFEDPALPGRVALRVEEWGGFGGFKAIFTRVMISQPCNYQFLHTLGGSIYVYVFGDRIGQLALTGLAFDSACGANNSVLGIENVLKYYNKNRLSTRKQPLKITIGAATTLTAYLAAITADVADPANQVYQFTLNLMLVPPFRNRRNERDVGGTETPAVDPGDGLPADEPAESFPELPAEAPMDGGGAVFENGINVAFAGGGFMSGGGSP